MAIVQISRITHRKGLYENLPQLAGGEFGWALDERRLFIGNGTLADGAPVVGNTEILTEYSDILSFSATYTYKGEVVSPLDPNSKAVTVVQTGSTSTNSVTRSLQSKLDDFASVKDFGAVGDGSTDDTDAINRALEQLFTKQVNQEIRRSLFFPAGVYLITGTINIPTYAKLYGEGKRSTIIRYNSYDGSSVDEYVVRTADSLQQTGANIATNGAVRPSYIEVSSMTFEALNEMSVLLVEKATKCVFDSVELKNALTTVELTDAFEDTAAIRVVSNAGLETSEIVFDKCTLSNTTYGMYIDYNCKGVTLSNSSLDTHYQGVVLGAAPINNGPTGVRIQNNTFDNIYSYGVYIGNVTFNVLVGNVFFDVGNGFNGAGNPTTPIVSINNINNLSIGDMFERDDSDNLLYRRIELNDLGGIVIDGGKGFKLGNRVASPGLLTTLVDNTSSATTISHEVLNITVTETFQIEYSITRGTSSRIGIIRVAPDWAGGSSPTYSDDYDEFGTTGVVLTITQSSNRLYLNYTTTSTGTDAALRYSVVRFER